MEVRQHDILKDELETEHFDLVHCRALLMHLNEPERALERMVGALRPGGWLLAEEADYSSFGAADPDHPLSRDFDRILRDMVENLRESGVEDAFFGRQLRGMVETFDLISIDHEGVSKVVRGEEVEARYHRMNFCELVYRPRFFGHKSGFPQAAALVA